MKRYYFAVDLGATSGRTIVGSLNDGKLEMEELTRFSNNLIETGRHTYWDIYALYFEIIRGLKEAKKRDLDIVSIGIDTWGVDIVCVAEDGSVSQPISYRDSYTIEAMEEFFNEKTSREKVYEKTGIQIMNFNTLFQLYAMRREKNSALEGAKKILFMPDALSYMLTGEMVCEYTIASTSSMLNPRTRDFDEELLQKVGLNHEMFGRMVMPGEKVGTLLPNIQSQTGYGPLPVVAVAGHDTASAVAGIPAENERYAFLSSGTWSLMGIVVNDAIINKSSYEHNFTNEGGLNGTIRFLKNICGMWIYERCRKEWTDASTSSIQVPESHAEMQAEAMKQEPFRSIINPDDPMFANPKSMVEAIKDYCKRTNQPVPEGYAQMCRCIFDSLTMRYKEVLDYLREVSPFPIEVLHIISGGSQNKYLNQLTSEVCGIKVVAGPKECTAIGNLKVQIKNYAEGK